MSPNVGNFVHDLVEMAKAMETLPQVEHERDQLKAEVDRLSQSVQDRELRIVDYKSKVDELLARVRATEAERDDAELRFLDLEEKSNKVLAKLSSITAAAHDAAMVIEPPKPQPEPEVQPQPPVSEAVHSIEPQPQGQGEGYPTHGNEPSQSVAGTDTTKTAQTGEGSSPAAQPPASQDQREVNPSATAEAGGSQTVPIQNASSGESADTTNTDKPSGPYAGKHYRDVTGYVSYNDWIEGGGIYESYYH